jgi:lincosamide nucleotidyltransferase A/C/D/E
MISADVLRIYRAFENAGIQIWIDGGWCIDALLGEQTRPHQDLDIVIQQKDLEKALELMKEQGYRNVPRDDTKPWNFVMGDDKRREIDVHVIVFDEKGDGIYGPIETGDKYPAGSLTGIGKINKYPVRCVSPQFVVEFHKKYEPREKDIKDMSAFCSKFHLDFPYSK